MALNPEHLLSFARVAETGSVSTAAETLFRSQPAISQHLRQLTEAMGEPLYRRHSGGVTLTDTGLALLPHAQALERALAGAQRLAREVQGLERGVLAIGASMTIAVYLLPRLLSRFHRQQPGLDLQLLTRNSSEVLNLLSSGRIDVALVETPVAQDELPDFEQRTLFTDEVVLAVPPGHPLASAGSVKPADLDGCELVVREPGSGTRRVMELALAQLGVNVRAAIETSGIEAAKEAILQGLGAGFISRLAVERELSSGLLKEVQVDGLSLQRQLTLLHPPAELCSRSSRQFLEFLEAVRA